MALYYIAGAGRIGLGVRIMRVERWISREAVVLACLLGFGSPTMAGDSAPLPPVWIDYSSSGAAIDFATKAGFAGNDRIYSMEF